MAKISKLMMLLLVLLNVCAVSQLVEAGTSVYVFSPDQSTIVKTGGFAGVHETYSIGGQFQLAVDSDAGVASFEKVNASLSDEIDSEYGRSLNEIFNMTALTGTVVDDTTIQFEGKTADGTESDVRLKLSLEEDSAHITGNTTPPPNSADMFFYDVNAVATKKYAGGTGEPNSPYQITTAEDLMLLGETHRDYDNHFILTADINLDPNLPGRKVFDSAVIAPYGDTPFTGAFDGDGYTILYLTIDGLSYLGLFGELGSGAMISNLGLEKVDVNGNLNVGGLVGRNNENARVFGSYSTGSVRGSGMTVAIGRQSSYRDSLDVGGLVGTNYGKITDCNSTSDVSGNNDVGGLVGSNHDTITQCYSTGSVTGSSRGRNIGGLVGHNRGSIAASYSTSLVIGDSSVGGLVGTNHFYGVGRGNSEELVYGRLDQCYSTGVVSGNSDVGGLMGVNNNGKVTNCYSTSSVIGHSSVGGLVGTNQVYGVGLRDSEELVYYGSPDQCYSTGVVSGNSDVGGLVGSGDWRKVTGCFWNTQTSGEPNSAGGTGLTTAKMQTAHTFALWVNGHDAAIWTIDEGRDYPRLLWQNKPGELILPVQLGDIVGAGTADDPCLIFTPVQLNVIGLVPWEWHKHFKLMADIDLSGLTDGELNIIGVDGIRSFTGFFDGNGKIISDFTYSLTTRNHVGLFGHVSNGHIKNVRLKNPNVSGKSRVGSLVGYAFDSTIENCHVEGGAVSGIISVGGLVGHNTSDRDMSLCSSTCVVDGYEQVGGLVGINDIGSVAQCYSAGTVTGAGSDVGGLVGRNWFGMIDNCYSTSTVSGDNSVGGLVGNNFSGRGDDNYRGIVAQCYSTGTVSGNSDVGGLVGITSRWLLDVTGCFWDIQTSGQANSAGGTDKYTNDMQKASTFLDAGWDFVDETANGTENIWWILEGQDYPRLWWQFWAFSPYPECDATDVAQPLLLHWKRGRSAQYHDVYFGEDEEAVAAATTESLGIYRGRQPVEMTTYDPGMLEWATTYYWRVDEVNEVDPNIPWKRNIWTFTTADFLVVDDFEGYDAYNSIWRTWQDGLTGLWPDDQSNMTGSAVGDGRTGSYTEETIVHGGRQSLPYRYDNNQQGKVKYSEAEKILSYPRNWIQQGVAELSLWFHGDPVNGPEPMYVAIADGAGTPAAVYYDDPNATTIDSWTEWVVPLSTFADQGINLTHVDRIVIGFGNRGNMTASGGSGKMFFDDIRLYRPLP